MVHTIIRIIVNNGGPGFERWKKEMNESQPTSQRVIETHKTYIYPLPSMEINEATINGNIEVLEPSTRSSMSKPNAIPVLTTS